MKKQFDVYCSGCHKYLFSISYSSESSVSMLDAVDDAYGRRHYCDECQHDRKHQDSEDMEWAE